MKRKIIIGGAAIVLSIAFLLAQRGGSLTQPALAISSTAAVMTPL
jgi:hypothetical protein